MTYSLMEDWPKDKLLLARLIRKGMFKQAKDYARDITIVTDNKTVNDYLNGVSFVLDILSPRS